MEGEGGKGFSTLSHILSREKMRIQDAGVGGRYPDEQPQI